MELQNQIYLLIAVFGGLLVLLFVLIVVLSIYVRKTRQLFDHTKTGYSNDQFNGMDFVGEDRDRHRGVGAPSNHGYAMEMHGRTDYRSDLTKTRNDYTHNVRNINNNRAYHRGEVEAGYAGKRSEKAKSNSHGVPDSRVVPEEPFETEVSNIFDMDDLDEDLADRDSVEDGRSTRYLSNRAGTIGSSVDQKSPAGNQYGRRGNMANNANAGGGNRFHNAHAGNGKKKNGGSALVRDEVEGESQSNSYYNTGKEQGPYFNDRRINY